MFYYFFDYMGWLNWYYAVPQEVIELESKPEEPKEKLYKEIEPTSDAKVEIVPVNTDVNIAQLETEQESIPRKKRSRRW